MNEPTDRVIPAWEIDPALIRGLPTDKVEENFYNPPPEYMVVKNLLQVKDPSHFQIPEPKLPKPKPRKNFAQLIQNLKAILKRMLS